MSFRRRLLFLLLAALCLLPACAGRRAADPETLQQNLAEWSADLQDETLPPSVRLKVLRRRAEALTALRRYDEAARDYREAASIDPDGPDLVYAGNALSAAGDDEGALAAAGKVLERRPDDVNALYLRGRTLLLLGRPKPALLDLERVLAGVRVMGRQRRGPLAARGAALVAVGRVEDGLADLLEAESLGPVPPYAHAVAGKALADLGRDDEALDQLGAALDGDPTNISVRSLRAGLLLKRGRPGDALADYALLARMEPGRPDHWEGHVRSLAALGRFGEVVAECSRLLAAFPGRSAFLYHRAVALGALRRYPEALRDAEMLLGRDPLRPEYRGLRDALLRALGRGVPAEGARL